MNYEILALDVDGTLLNDDYELTAATKKAIRHVHAKGTRIVLCTGRSPVNAIPILEELGLEGVLITHNGAATVQSPSREVLHEYAFEVQVLQSLVQYCRQRRLHFDVCTAFGMYAEKIGSVEAQMYDKFMLRPEQIDDILTFHHPIVKFTLFAPEAVMDSVEKDFAQLSLPAGLHYIRSGALFIDVMSKDASKGKALAQLAEQWQVPSQQVIAMGNYYNDLEMLQYAGLGIAMANSPEPVKAAADAVTSSNNEDGVAAALNEFGLYSS